MGECSVGAGRQLAPQRCQGREVCTEEGEGREVVMVRVASGGFGLCELNLLKFYRNLETEE